jgi:hypothetical protein
MNYLLRSITIIAAFAAGATALASEPVHEVVQAPTAAAPALAPAPPAAPVTAAPQPAVAPTAKDNSTKNAPPKVPPGYKVKVIDGETRFCRKSAPVGTRFPTEVCMTQAQYQEQERNRESMRNEIQDRQKSYSITQ